MDTDDLFFDADQTPIGKVYSRLKLVLFLPVESASKLSKYMFMDAGLFKNKFSLYSGYY